MSTILTFARLKANPALLPTHPPACAIHPGCVTVLWQTGYTGDPLYCSVEWLADLHPLERLGGQPLWGADIPCPPLPDDICTRILIGTRSGDVEGRLSPLHAITLTGPATPAPFDPPVLSASLIADLMQPTPGLAEESRRVRVFAPASGDPPRVALLALDGQTFAGPDADLPAALDILRRENTAPPTLLVAVDSASGPGRWSEYLMDGAHNTAACQWISDTLLPTLTARYGIERWLVSGWSNSASMSLQLLLDRPDRFVGAAAFSPYHRDGFSQSLQLAQAWSGAGAIYLTAGGFGLAEAENLPRMRALAQVLNSRPGAIHYHEALSFGHNYPAWRLLLPSALRWLFATTSP